MSKFFVKTAHDNMNLCANTHKHTTSKLRAHLPHTCVILTAISKTQYY